MKSLPIIISFIAGALTLWLLTPSYKPVAELVVWTTTKKIAIPLSKQDSEVFIGAGTNLVIQGLSVNKL